MKLAVAALLLGLTGLAASLSQPLIPAFLNPNTGEPTQSRQSARLFLQSSELGLPQPLTRRRVYPPPPRFLGGERGAGRVPIPTKGHTLWFALFIRTLWVSPSKREMKREKQRSSFLLQNFEQYLATKIFMHLIYI
jgi:hypothetical protein